MSDKIIKGILLLLVINMAWNWIKTDVKDYSYYKTEYNRIRSKLDSLNTQIKTQDNEIDRIKRSMFESDSTIINASRPELDVLFSDFFGRLPKVL